MFNYHGDGDIYIQLLKTNLLLVLRDITRTTSTIPYCFITTTERASFKKIKNYQENFLLKNEK